MRRIFNLWITLSCLILHSQDLPPGFTIEVFAEGIEQPTVMAEAPDGRIFVAERTGKVRIIENGVLLDQPFYEVETEIPGERGITGMILHPDFEQNGFVYLYYTILDSNRNQLVRVTANGNTAIPNSEELIFLLDPMWAAWHNGGGMLFDDEGYLYLGVGDGTAWQASQEMTSTLGKVLRLNDDGSIPTDNPFYTSNDDQWKAIYVNGIRNPYTMSRSTETGQILVNDVGAEEWEEINELVAGANYGWGLIEGPIEPDEIAPWNYIDPVYSYSHEQGGCAVVGSSFYEPNIPIFPEFYWGKYLFMEYCQGIVYTLDPVTFEAQSFIEGLQLPNSLQVMGDGSMLISEIYNSRILKVNYTGSSAPFIIDQPQDVTTIIGEVPEFAVVVSSTVGLTFQWYRNGEPMTDSNSSILVEEAASLTDNGNEYYCVISNDEGTVTSATCVLTVLDETRPTIDVIRPLPTDLYNAGDTLWFEAVAYDNEDGDISGEGFTWNVFFHHNVHKHPAVSDLTGVTESYYVIPDQGEVATDVWFSVNLKVTDSAGLESLETIEVYPEICTLQVNSNLTGMTFLLDGAVKDCNSPIQSVSGLKRIIEVPSYHISNEALYKFEDWNSEVENTIIEITAIDTTLNAEYVYLHEYLNGSADGDLLVYYYNGTGENRVFFRSGEATDIDFNWSLVGPLQWEGFNSEDYSVVFQGSLIAPYSGTYDFSLLHSGSVKFEIEDSTVIEATTQWAAIETHSSTYELEAGTRYNFSLDYEHYTYASRLRLSWQFSELPSTPIPSDYLLDPYLIIDPPAHSDFRVYPNPSTGLIYLSLGTSSSSEDWDKGELVVYDVSGKVVFEQAMSSSNLSIDLRTLEIGLYRLKFSNPIETHIVTLLIE